MVPGHVVKVHAGHNSEVKKGQVLAEIDSVPNSDYSKVIAPVDGIVIDRQVEVGQTLGERQTVDLFVLAQDLEKEVYLFASVDEADIGLIRTAKFQDQPVFFTVEAYPEDLFEGKIQDVRINPMVEQNVVNYHVVVSAANPDLKLLPGMTAKVSFQIEKRQDVVKIPNAALRFFPKPFFVHPDDRRLLDGSFEETPIATTTVTTDTRAATERVNDRKKENRRHVWKLVGDSLRAVEVVTGLNDNTYTEMVSGNLAPGQQLVTGVK
jgi:HlyD family secretion protein